MPRYKSICSGGSELVTNNNKIGPWSRDLLHVQFKYHFFFFLGVSAIIPSVCPLCQHCSSWHLQPSNWSIRKFEDSIRSRDTLRHLAHMLPTLILSYGKKVAMTCAKAFLKGEWKSLWNKCRSQGVARQEKVAQAPQTATTQSTKQVDVLAQKYARARNLSKVSQTICSTLRPALKPDTLEKFKNRQKKWMICVVMTTGKKLKPNRFLS